MTLDVRTTKLKISQLRKKFRKENLNIEKRFKKAFLTKIKKENFWVSQLKTR